MSETKVGFGANVAEITVLLAEIRQRSNEALGREDKDPPSKPQAGR
jgi:hypothetical protein